MNINPNYSSDDMSDRSNVELTELALDAIQNNIIEKVANHLEIMDFVGFASVRVVLEEVARKADAYDQISNAENSFFKN